ncbi:DUF4249 domain-containing protein [Flavobacterium album]|uniref:DUF4249 domain-containing protein n=1 Tax=Flavobacterium album TaxID=2175091 RepID=A0A2S1R0K5_9FLAO|nr:DUF4249 domain-containing protein [Flavobacterium album]AWH86144.1 DUF4249 domain-containing protein [Flavobacterium album]
MKNIKYILLLITITLLASCEHVVDVDLDTAPPRLVVDASINWEKDTDGSQQTIRLTTTAPYYQNEVPPASGATVFITNTSGNVFNFIEDPGTGNYNCIDFVPQIGETYVLTINYQGQTYTATDKLYATPDIAYTTQDNEGGFFNDSVEVRFFFMDNGSEDNFYIYRFDTDLMPYPDYDAIDDEFFQGNEMFGIYDHEDFEPGDVLKIRLYGVSQRYYNYMDQLIDIAEGGAGSGPFQTVPANVRGNIVNQASPDNYALGYFRLGQVDTLDYVIQ